MDALALWTTYAEHVARLFRAAPHLTRSRGDAWFAVLTREDHADVNQCVLAPGATAADAEHVVSLIADADVPAVVSVSSGADAVVTEPLVRAELRREALPEPLMWCTSRPGGGGGAFAVARVRSPSELRRAIAVCAAGHSIDEGLLARLLHREVGDGEDVSTWAAYDGDEPISVVWLTRGERIGVWEMMTPPAHRRRGAARAVLGAALAEAWLPSTEGAFLWASPLGRPLYESSGFRAVDEPSVWVTKGAEAASLAVGQPGV